MSSVTPTGVSDVFNGYRVSIGDALGLNPEK